MASGLCNSCNSVESMKEAQKLRFSPCVFDAAAVRPQPSTLLLTQNIGGIESVAMDEEEDGVPTSTANLSFISTASRLTVHDDRHDVEDGAGVVTEEVQRQTLEFIADLRAWLHQAAFAVAHGEDVPDRSASATTRPSGAAVIKPSRRASGKPAAAFTATEYSVTATPPQLDVIVIHLQEIGGKYANAAFTTFFAEHMKQHLLPEAGWCSGLLTDSPLDREKFTAAGTIVFVSPRMCPITSVLVLPHRTYIPVLDDPASYGGNHTRLFHSAKFANAGSSRKGFVLTSLRLGTTLLHCCNVHLFNDVSNAVALEASPSVYVPRRAEALLEAAAECLTLVGKDDPVFFFGDFNIRLDGKAVAAYAKTTFNVDVVAKTKSFVVPDTFWTSLFDNAVTTRTVLSEQFDVEPRQLLDRVARETQMELAELPVTFSPTYLRFTQPYTARWQHTDQTRTAYAHVPVPSLVASREGRPYTHTRLPAWCDRVFFNPAALEFVAGRCGLPPPTGERMATVTPATAASAKGSIGRYLYDAVQLCHTDHDGVFLLF